MIKKAIPLPLPLSQIGTNIFYESPENKFDDLCETSFLLEIVENIKIKLNAKFDEYNFYIYSSFRKKDFPPNSISHKSNNKKILLYISDEFGEVPYDLAPHYFCIFKMYLQTNKFSVNNIFNFPLGCEKQIPKLEYKDIDERKYSVFFSGNLNKSRLPLYFNLVFNKAPNAVFRQGIKVFTRINFLKKTLTLLKFDSKFPNGFIRFTNGFKQGLSPELYGEIMANSKIVLCPKGFFLTECFRHFEAMRAGCVIISEKLPETYFYKNSPIIQVSEWEEGIKIANDLLNNKNELKRLSKSTLDWWENSCSENATAKYVIECIESLENKNTIHN